jgi:uncharacterized membrane protein
MKKLLSLFIIGALLLTGCADNKVINGNEYSTYGLINESTKKNPNIMYEISVCNVIWGVLLVQTVIAPLYFFGFSIYEPVRAMNSNSAANIGVVED